MEFHPNRIKMNPNFSNKIQRYTVDEDKTFATIGLKTNEKTLHEATALHWHEFFEIELILSGKGFHHQNDTTDVIEQGFLCFLTPMDFHQVEPIESLEVINLTFNDAWIPSEFLTLFLNKQQFSVTKLTEDTFEYFKIVFKKLCDEFSQNREHRAFYIKNLINCILTELVYVLQPTPDCIYEDNSNMIRRALTYLYCNFRNSPNLHEVAEVAGLCDNYFSEVFRKSTGQTFNRFLNNLKLQYAYDLLLHTKKSITEICFASGFNSMTHFQREFKKKYHCTPSEKR